MFSQETLVTPSHLMSLSLQVSSVTQTTATEKEVLAQLLQEKDQLQREQEDRIKNLTTLLVTSSNQVAVKKVCGVRVVDFCFLAFRPNSPDAVLKVPKRRVTWGGKMQQLSQRSTCEDSPSNVSFAGPVMHKWKADRSCLVGLAEGESWPWSNQHKCILHVS